MPPQDTGRRFALLRELERYHPSAAEHRAHAEVITLLGEPGDPFSAYRFDPGHVTAGGLVLSPDRERVLLVHHRSLGIWIEPGGHVDPGDADVAASARREVIEETGVDPIERLGDGILDVDVHPIPAHRSQPPHRHFNVVYGFVAAGEGIEASDEVAAVRWQTVAELAELTSDAAVLRAARKLRAIAG